MTRSSFYFIFFNTGYSLKCSLSKAANGKVTWRLLLSVLLILCLSVSYSVWTSAVIFLKGSQGYALSFRQKIVPQDFNLWLLDMTKHNIKNTYVSYLPFFQGINKRSV